MTDQISNRAFVTEIQDRLLAFCRRNEIKFTVLSSDDGRDFRIKAHSRDYSTVIEAADVLEENYLASGQWREAYLATPEMRPCPVGSFHDPLVKEMNRLSHKHFSDCGRFERARREYATASRDWLRQVRKARMSKFAGASATSRKAARQTLKTFAAT